MKIFFTLTVVICTIFNFYAQQTIQLPNYPLSNEYYLEASAIDPYTVSFTLVKTEQNNEEKKQEFTVRNFNYENFKQALEAELDELENDKNDPQKQNENLNSGQNLMSPESKKSTNSVAAFAAKKDRVLRQTNEAFFFFKQAIIAGGTNNSEAAPNAGELCLNGKTVEVTKKADLSNRKAIRAKAKEEFEIWAIPSRNSKFGIDYNIQLKTINPDVDKYKSWFNEFSNLEIKFLRDEDRKNVRINIAAEDLGKRKIVKILMAIEKLELHIDEEKRKNDLQKAKDSLRVRRDFIVAKRKELDKERKKLDDHQQMYEDRIKKVKNKCASYLKELSEIIDYEYDQESSAWSFDPNDLNLLAHIILNQLERLEKRPTTESIQIENAREQLEELVEDMSTQVNSIKRKEKELSGSSKNRVQPKSIREDGNKTTSEKNKFEEGQEEFEAEPPTESETTSDPLSQSTDNNQVSNEKIITEKNISFNKEISKLGQVIKEGNKLIGSLDRIINVVESLNLSYEEDEIYLKRVASDLQALQSDDGLDELSADKAEIYTADYAKESYEKSENIITLEKKIDDLESEVLALQKDIKIYSNKYDLEIEDVKIEFSNGFVENIIVTGEVSNGEEKEKLKLENKTPFGFSDKRHYEWMKRMKLYASNGLDASYEIEMNDLFENYYQQLAVNRYDYSPENSVIDFTLETADDYCKPLKKEETYRILQAKVFSDFVGLDDTEPNGIIQTEVSKIIPLVVKKKFAAWEARESIFFKWMSFVEPMLTLSKIEEENRFLPLKGATADSLFESTLNLRRFEQLSVGLNLNAFSLSIPSAKVNFYSDLGWHFGRVPVAVEDANLLEGTDLEETFTANATQLSPQVGIAVTPDERYSVDLRYTLNWYKINTNSFRQYGKLLPNFGDEERRKFFTPANRFSTLELQASLRPNSKNDNRFFFRYRYHWQKEAQDVGFHQAQVGYSFYLLGNQMARN